MVNSSNSKSKVVYDNDVIDASSSSSKKASRKRQRNPLSHARGKQQSHESIWFRRIGAGYHLFAEYYAGQPLGTLCCEQQQAVQGEEEDSMMAKNSNNSTSTGASKEQNQHGKGAGLSRAAKRRKKKKQQQRNNFSTNDAEDQHNAQQEVAEANSNVPESASPTKKQDKINEQEYQNHPLVQALNKQSTAVETKQVAALLRPCFIALSKPLPVTFRLRRSLDRAQLQELCTKIQQEFQFLVKPLPFGGNNNDGNFSYIYQANCSKPDLTKKYTALKHFLMEYSQNGTLARQEVGSMLPLLALEHAGAISSGGTNNDNNNNKKKKTKCRILDLCASPGSKTLQALELMIDPTTTTSHGPTASTGRCILANDVSESRLQALKDAIQRSGMPEQHLNRIGYTCEDARQLSTSKPAHVIICDVPCSGDGTVRKDAHILELWKPSQGNALHALQLQILQRALSLVQVGGVVCYSTCSLNPVENEAVVAAALRNFNNNNNNNNRTNSSNEKTATGDRTDKNTDKNKDYSSSGDMQQPMVELLEFPEIPGFQRRPGLSHWRIAYHEDANTLHHKGGNGCKDDNDDDEIPHLVWYSTYQDARKHKMENALPTMWPRGSDNGDDSTEQHLDRCTRLWPQDHDTGGFFLALIRRNHY